MNKYVFLTTFFVFAFWTSDCLAQIRLPEGFRMGDTSQVQQIITKRGDIFHGRISNLSDSSLKFLINNDTAIELEFDEIVDITLNQVSTEQHKKNRSVLIGLENLWINTSAFTLEKGEGELRNIEVFLTMIDYGLTDHITIGVGYFIPVYAIARLKASTNVHKSLRLGLGTNTFIGMLPVDGSDSFSHLFGIATIGSEDKYLNITGGYYLPFDDLGDKKIVTSIGGSYRFRENWRLFADFNIVPNVNFDNGGFLPSFGASWLITKNRIEFGLLAFPGFDILVPIPVISYARRF